MKNISVRSLSFLLFCFLLASCEKDEKPVTLPPVPEGVQVGTATMGETFETQVYYNLEQGKVVATAPVNSWHLAFQASQGGTRVFMNGGSRVNVYNTGMTDFGSVTSMPVGITADSWAFDMPSGNPDSTGIGEWCNAGNVSKNEVYLVKLSTNDIRKIQLRSATPDAYEIYYGKLDAATPQVITLPKDPAYNFTYFHFDNGIAKPEPVKTDWDIVFTYYRHIYTEYDNLPYQVAGVLLNPFQTAAAADTLGTYKFDEITEATIPDLVFSTNRDIVGFDWKYYDLNTGQYTTYSWKNYIVQTQQGQYYKLRFIDYYDANQKKGTPKFEFKRIK